MNFLIQSLFPFWGNVELSILLKAIFIYYNKEYLTNVDILAASEGSIPLEEGEELWLIETDQGDGWTR